MSQLSIRLPETPLTVTPEEFAAIAAANPDLQLERSAKGELIVNPPTGGESDSRNATIIARLVIWAESYGGMYYGATAGFVLPNGATKSPDAAWVEQSRYDALTPQEREGFVPLCPDFVVELRSPSDRLSTLQDKMREYIENGARLGWLIDPQTRRVEIYRPGGDREVLEQPEALSGEEVLPGFRLPLTRIWR
ncbi:MAG: Uma2 family endonuclease [Halothece sp.]